MKTKTLSQTVSEEQESFYHAVDLRRRNLNLVWKEVCNQAGIHQSVVTRLGQQKPVDGSSIFALSAWLKQTKGVGGRVAMKA